MVTILVVLFINCFIAVWGYSILNRLRLLYSDRFGFIVAITGSYVSSLVITNNLFYLFSENFTLISCINLVIGIGIGIAFGSFVNAQTFIAGTYTGGIGALMGTMIGAVSKNPAICAIPTQIYTEHEFILFFGLFGLALHLLTISLLCYSLRV